MASMTENLNLQRGLLKRLDQLSAVDLLDKIKVESIEHSASAGNAWPVVKTSDGRSLRCRLLVHLQTSSKWLTLTRLHN